MALSIAWRGLNVPQINIPENDTPEKIGMAARGIFKDIKNHQAAGAVRGEEESVKRELDSVQAELENAKQRRDSLKEQSDELGAQIQALKSQSIVPAEPAVPVENDSMAVG